MGSASYQRRLLKGKTMTDVIEAIHVAPKTTTEVFVMMNRYGDDYWSACTTYKTLEDAQRSVMTSETVQAWKIVKVSGLPVDVHAGEAETPNVELRGAEQASLAERPSRTQGSASPSCED
jgi:S-adenosylhomocysteine hydrolase